MNHSRLSMRVYDVLFIVSQISVREDNIPQLDDVSNFLKRMSLLSFSLF